MPTRLHWIILRLWLRMRMRMRISIAWRWRALPCSASSIAIHIDRRMGCCRDRDRIGILVSGWRVLRLSRRLRTDLGWLRRARSTVGLLLGPVFSQRADDGAADCAQEAMAGLLASVATRDAAAYGSEQATVGFGGSWALRVRRWLAVRSTLSTVI